MPEAAGASGDGRGCLPEAAERAEHTPVRGERGAGGGGVRAERIEPKLRRLMGYEHLPLLRERLKRLLKLDGKPKVLPGRDVVAVGV